MQLNSVNKKEKCRKMYKYIQPNRKQLDKKFIIVRRRITKKSIIDRFKHIYY